MGTEDLYQMEEPIFQELYVCPFCDFKTRIEDIMKEHMKRHFNEEKPKFNPTQR